MAMSCEIYTADNVAKQISKSGDKENANTTFEDQNERYKLQISLSSKFFPNNMGLVIREGFCVGGGGFLASHTFFPFHSEVC